MAKLSIYRIPLILFLFCTLIIASWANNETTLLSSSFKTPPTAIFVPTSGQTRYVVMAIDGDAGKSQRGTPYQQCGQCKCCPSKEGASPKCSTMSCCFAIICNVPGKPFGTCSLEPKKCNCDKCGST
ncbi:hypothetical protein H6P81_014731 [Aristolochia fimbriata]|uniref:DUF7866 domain-containing protein n=1 Tax=Aristolochia fimbriata TaxID=158543 RepID=A0AAV7E4R8_ARIFI|nr:hypothetical protein H6P81_014731 [Aristolochia fimbriata]